MSDGAAMALVERGLVPDAVVRWGIRRLLARRLAAISTGDPEEAQAAWIRRMRASPIALVPETANAQHYEVPTAFFRQVLGPRMKYSGCLWSEGVGTLAAAEEAMLALTGRRAGLEDGQRVLELGCGWGSLTLWMAERYPASRILAVSNSRTQREHIEGEVARLGLSNVRVVTEDMNGFDPAPTPGARFDRVVSVEMFEHMRNWEALLGRIHGWLAPQGRVFLHVFSHRERSYPFEDRGSADWMARWFFAGGMMPSDTLLPALRIPFEVETHDVVPGVHYARTAEAWLANQDAHREEALRVLAGAYGAAQGARWHHRWRTFFLACAELFGWRGGTEWAVSHYRLAPRSAGERTC